MADLSTCGRCGQRWRDICATCTLAEQQDIAICRDCCYAAGGVLQHAEHCGAL